MPGISITSRVPPDPTCPPEETEGAARELLIESYVVANYLLVFLAAVAALMWSLGRAS
jgi:hypothetical protein